MRVSSFFAFLDSMIDGKPLNVKIEGPYLWLGSTSDLGKWLNLVEPPSLCLDNRDDLSILLPPADITSV